MKIAFDMGGVITRDPHVFRTLAQILANGGAEVFVLTDMNDKQLVVKLLTENGFDIPYDRILCADYATHGEECKAVLIDEYGIDLLFDDHPGYCAARHRAVSLFVWPDPARPYYSDDFKGDMPWRRPKKGA